MSFFRKLVVILAFFTFGHVFILAQEAPPRSYFVSASGNDESNNGRSESTAFKTIKRAIEVASQGAIKRIIVLGTLSQSTENGKYRDTVFDIAYEGKSELIICGKGNSTAKEKAILSASGTKKRVVKITGGGPIRFENIEISGANTDGYGAGVMGGGKQQITLGNGTIIKNNITSENGGGLLAQGNCTIEEGVEITQNTAKNGGGIYIPYSWNTLTIKGGTISKNSSVVDGGGIYFENAYNEFTIENGIVKDNIAGNNGGGLYLQDKCVIQNVSITNNSAKNMGGGIYMGRGGYGAASVEIGSFDIQNNKAQFGAGLYLAAGKCSLSSGSIKNNIAGFVGGGVYVATKSEFIPNESVITENKAGDGGENLFNQE
jgi:predicted outer membrane repeat protein